MTSNNFVPKNIKDFFETSDKNVLFQGDIIDAYTIGLKNQGDPDMHPDFYIIISKSCDISFRDPAEKLIDGLINVLPLIPLKILQKKLKDSIVKNVISANSKILLLPIHKLIQAFAGVSVGKIDNLVKGQHSRFMYVPPDGKILIEPMVIDFELPNYLNGDEAENISNLLNGKRLQLVSPFREKLGQRFGAHFSSIGLNDDSIRDNAYVKTLKEHLKKHNETIGN